jgi:hypothetical protein
MLPWRRVKAPFAGLSTELESVFCDFNVREN